MRETSVWFDPDNLIMSLKIWGKKAHSSCTTRCALFGIKYENWICAYGSHFLTFKKLYYILLHESECDMAKYFKSWLNYFHKPEGVK